MTNDSSPISKNRWILRSAMRAADDAESFSYPTLTKSHRIIMRNVHLKIVVAAWTTVLGTFASTLMGAEPVPNYEEQVAPILRMYCVSCHNGQDREGGLSLETFVELQEGGTSGAAVLATQAKSSRLIRYVTGAAEPKMPPEGSPAPSAAEVAVLAAWIDGGAKGPAGVELRPRMLKTPSIRPRADLIPGITALAWTPDGKLQAIARFGRVDLVDAESGQIVRSIAGFPGKLFSVHFSYDGKHLVTASGVTGLYGVAALWNVDSGERVQEFQGHRDAMFDAELSPDGRLLATCSYDHRVLLWDVASGKIVRTLEGHNGAIYDLAFSPDGTVLASASGDETIKLWRVADGERLDTLGQPQAEQYVVLFSPDGRSILAGGADNRIRVWRFVSRTQPEINPLQFARYAHEGAVTALAFSSDGQLLISAAEDRTIKVWETQGYTQQGMFADQSDLVSALAPAPQTAQFLAARLDGSLARLPLERPVTREPGASRTVGAVANSVQDQTVQVVEESEPNSNPAQAQRITLPARIRGVIGGAGLASAPAATGQSVPAAATESAKPAETVGTASVNVAASATPAAPAQGANSPSPSSADVDLFRFTAEAGQSWVLEVNAARQKSPLDSYLEVLNTKGEPVERVLMRAVRDSYFTFRGQDSNTSDGFRLHNWEEMELNEFLYAGGEVVKLWHYPRGPDSGFMLYPGRGSRHTFFDTTPISHPVHEPCYIVQPLPPGTPIIPNGLPVFPLYFENDDDSRRQWGTDSRLMFTAPESGEYVIRLSDSRGFAGPDFRYELTVRPSQPDFTVRLEGSNPVITPGAGWEFRVVANRQDGFSDPIDVHVDGLPPGFHVTQPLTIEAGQESALGVLWAEPNAALPTAEQAQQITVTARAAKTASSAAVVDSSAKPGEAADRPVPNTGTEAIVSPSWAVKKVGNFGAIKFAEKPTLLVTIVPESIVPDGATEKQASAGASQPIELVIAPGQTLAATVRVDRRGFEGRIDLGKADAGRNLPHGVYVDNIGLNGLLIVEGKQERTFYITAAPWVPETTRPFHLVANIPGSPASIPVLLHVRRPANNE